MIIDLLLQMSSCLIYAMPIPYTSTKCNTTNSKQPCKSRLSVAATNHQEKAFDTLVRTKGNDSKRSPTHTLQQLIRADQPSGHIDVSASDAWKMKKLIYIWFQFPGSPSRLLHLVRLFISFHLRSEHGVEAFKRKLDGKLSLNVMRCLLRVLGHICTLRTLTHTHIPSVGESGVMSMLSRCSGNRANELVMHDRMVICGVKASANSKNKNKNGNACVCLESAARERERERGSSADGADARPAWLWPTGEVHRNKKGCFTGIWRFIRVK